MHYISFYLISKDLWKADFIIFPLRSKKCKVKNTTEHAKASSKYPRANLVDQNSTQFRLRWSANLSPCAQVLLGSDASLCPLILTLFLWKYFCCEEWMKDVIKRESRRWKGEEGFPCVFTVSSHWLHLVLPACDSRRQLSGIADFQTHHSSNSSTALSSLPFQHPGAKEWLLWIKIASVGPGIMWSDCLSTMGEQRICSTFPESLPKLGKQVKLWIHLSLEI